MAFTPANSGTGTDHSRIIPVIGKNSTVVAVGELVKLDTTVGFATNPSAAAPCFGIVVGFANSSGTPLSPSAYAAGSQTSSDVQSFTFASDNQTVAKNVVLVETHELKVWSAQVNGTVGTTAHSDVIGAGLDVDSANSNYARVLETTATRTAATVTNFMGLGTDPNDSTRILVKIRSSSLTGNVS